MKPTTSNPRTNKKGRKKRVLPKKIRDLPDADERFDVLFPQPYPQVSGTVAGDTSTPSGSSQTDDVAIHPSTPSQENSSDEETSIENSSDAPQNYTGDFPIAPQGNYRFILPRQTQPVIDNVSGDQDNSSDEETSIEDSSDAPQDYTGDFSIAPQGNYRFILPQQPQPVGIDNVSGEQSHTSFPSDPLVPHSTALSQDNYYHEWPVRAEVPFHVMQGQDVVGISSWGAQTFYPQDNRVMFFEPHAADNAYTSSQMSEYAGQWMEGGSGSGSG